jgi:hypothetical protein
MPTEPADRGPGLYHHPFRHQTLLTTTQLASCVRLPATETAGFMVTSVPGFDVQRPVPAQGPVLGIGQVVERHRATDIAYEVAQSPSHGTCSSQG